MDRRDDNKKRGKATINYNLNPSNQLLFEERLKKCLAKYAGEDYDGTRHAPRNKHSPFGDFPKNYLPSKTQDFGVVDIESHQVAHAVTSSSRSKTRSKPFSKTTAFSSLKKSTKEKPPMAGAFNPRSIPVSDFRLHYDRGDLPILMKHERGCKIQWKDEKFENFNFQLFLPIFVDGIREKHDPYKFLSIQGTFDLLDRVKDSIVKIIPQLILPLKAALNTRDQEVIGIALKVYLYFMLNNHII